METTPPVYPWPPQPSIPLVKNAFAHKAAKFSAYGPILGIALCMAVVRLGHGNRTVTLIGATLGALLFISGLICGIVALFGIRRYGAAGILVRSIIGVVFNGVFVVLMAIGFISGLRATTADQEKQIAEIARITKKQTLSLARSSFETHLIANKHEGSKPAQPPRGLFDLVHFPSSAGDLAAYVSPHPNDNQKHPAIIWMFGGFSNSIDDGAWQEATPDNDQSGSAFRKAGIVMMYPSLRGGNDNAGFKESFYGEVEDVLSAYDYLASLDYVDTNRIYLGGHSTGGTLVLLTSEYSKVFRAVFSFGPVASVADYGRENLTFKISDQKELQLRSPYFWMDCVGRPTFVFEGMEIPGNFQSLVKLESACRNQSIHFHPVPGKTHFSILAPATKLVAQKILADDKDGPCNIAFSEGELGKL